MSFYWANGSPVLSLEALASFCRSSAPPSPFLLSLSEVLGMRLVLGPNEVLTILSAFIPFAFFAAAIQILVAAFAKSFKEAQTYLNMTMFLPMAPGLIMSFKPVSPSLWMAFVPALSHHHRKQHPERRTP